MQAIFQINDKLQQVLQSHQLLENIEPTETSLAKTEEDIEKNISIDNHNTNQGILPQKVRINVDTENRKETMV